MTEEQSLVPGIEGDTVMAQLQKLFEPPGKDERFIEILACDWSVFTNPVFLLVDRSNEFIYADRKIPSCS